MSVTIKLRSPRYPVIGLSEAIERVRAVYGKDHLNAIPKAVVAEHMGYNTLNGASLGVISAVSKFGLLSGGSDAMKVSDRALAILVHDTGDPARVEAVQAASRSPALFEELFTEFPNGASDNAIKSFLLGRKKFLPSAVPAAIRAFKDTLAFIQAEVVDYEFDPGDRNGDEEGIDEVAGGGDQVRIPSAQALMSQPAQGATGGFEIGFTGQAIRLLGNICSQEEADKVLKAIEGLKFMLPSSA